MPNSTVNARDSRFILVRALDRDRETALRPVDVSLCVGLIVMLCCISRYRGAHGLSLYREGCGAITILVESKEGVMNQIQKVLFIGIRLVWPILLGFGVADAAPLLASARGSGQGPRPVVTSLGNPVGPASTAA